MHRISFDGPILHHCPAFRVGVVTAKVAAGRSPSTLIDEMNREADRLIQTCSLPAIKEIPAIAATRSCYKRTGKDPNRYRPSAEQLSRRVVRGLALLYQYFGGHRQPFISSYRVLYRGIRP